MNWRVFVPPGGSASRGRFALRTCLAGRRPRGFTLLEVIVAVSILGLGLTVVLTSQTGLFATAQRVENLTIAANLARCKMSEVELHLLEEGFSLIERTDSGPCCEDESDGRFECEWTVQTVELPQPATFAEGEEGTEGLDEGMDALGETMADAATGSGMSGDLGALGAMMSLQQSGGAALGETASTEDLASAFTEADPTGGAGMLTMAMGMVYPDLKPMLEASIRKVTLHVKWREGSRDQDLEVVQYVTNPMEGSLSPNAADGVEALMEQLGSITGGGTEAGEER